MTIITTKQHATSTNFRKAVKRKRTYEEKPSLNKNLRST